MSNAMSWPEWGWQDRVKAVFLVMLAASLPLEHTPALRYLCVIVVFLCSLGDFRPLEWQGKRGLVLVTVAWVVFSLASWFWSVAPNLTERHWFSDVLVPVFALLGAYSSRKIAVGLLKPCLLAFTWALFLTAVGFLCGIDALSYYYSGFGISSTLALVVLPFWLGLLQGGKEPWRWIVAGHLLMLLAVGLISANRMFWVVSLVILMLFVALHYSLNLKKTLLLGLAGVLVALLPLYFIFQWRMGGEGGIAGFGNMFAHDARFVIWRYWLSLGWHSPWFGIGFGRGIQNYFYGGAVPAELVAIDGNIKQHAHNIFLNVFVQLGIVGLLIYVLLFGTLLVRTYKGFIDSRRDMFWAAPFLSLLAVLLKNQTDDFLVFATPAAVMLFLGMALAYLRGFTPRSYKRPD